MNKKKYFSVEEANSIVGKISPVVQELVELKKKIELRVPGLKPILGKISSNGGGNKNLAEHLESIERMEQLVSALQSAGCILKDINMGLIDFPYLKDGREVYLCWKLGEKRIGYWHEIDAGFAGRKPIDDNNNLVD